MTLNGSWYADTNYDEAKCSLNEIWYVFYEYKLNELIMQI